MGTPLLLKKNRSNDSVINKYNPININKEDTNFPPQAPYRGDRSIQDDEAKAFYSNWIKNRPEQFKENHTSWLVPKGYEGPSDQAAQMMADEELKHQLARVNNTPANLYATESKDELGVYDPNIGGPYGRIEIPRNTIENELGNTMLHERTHSAVPTPQIEKIKQLKKEHGYEDTAGYWDRPSEMYSRLMTLRKNLGLQPGQVVTPGMIETKEDFTDPNFVPDKSETYIKSFIELGRANMLKYPKKLLLDMLNKVAENKNTNNPTDPRPLVAQDGRKLTLQTMIATRQKGGLLVGRKKKNSADASFTPEKVQQRVKEYEDVKNKQANKPAATINKPTERYDENEGLSFDKAFAKAKKAGDGTFKWMGKMYNTQSKSVPKNQDGAKMTNKEIRKDKRKAYWSDRYETEVSRKSNIRDRASESPRLYPARPEQYTMEDGITRRKPTDPKYKNKEKLGYRITHYL
jgi:hypothetical protein